jgi:RND family efflux transporter MFP subunit
VSANPEFRSVPGATDLAEAQRTELDAAWRQFGAAANPEEFCQSWLALQCHAIARVSDAVVVLQKPGTESFAPLAFWPEGRRDRSRLAGITERALREGRGLVQPRDGGGAAAQLPDRPDYQLAYLVRLDGQARGVVGMDIAWRDEAQLQTAMRQLQWGAGWLEVLLRRYADPKEASRQRVKLVMQLVAVFVERPSLENALSALVTETATQLGCDRVALGIVRGGTVRVEAMSHTVQFDRHANLITATAAAMTEALDQREPIVYPPDRDGRLAITFAHAELAQLSGAGGVVTLPLVHGDQRAGALTLERASGMHFDAPVIELLESLAAMLGPLLAMRLALERSLPSHIADSAREARGRLFGPRHGGFKLAAIALGLLLLFAIFATGSYRVSGEARIEGQTQRALTAPFPGYVREALRRAGDVVRRGEPLARLDDRDLKLERVRLQAQREQHLKQYREAMAKRDRAQVSIVSAQVQQVEAQLALAEEQLARAELVAPFDGIVVSGDFSQALGAPLERGQVLFEVATLDAYRVAIQVDERNIADLRVGQAGELVLAAMPESRYRFAIRAITPVTSAKEGRNFFRVEAELGSGQSGQLRPGMEGVAKIEVEERRLVSIWTRELVNWIRIKLWAWLP